MKNSRLAYALLASAAMLCNSVTAFAQDTSASNQPAAPAPTPSKISAVTVYTDRAIVTRTASADLAAGDSTIVLEKLPAGLLDASVQVRGRGTASATILDVTTATTFTDKTDPATQPRVKELQGAIIALDKRLAALNDRAAILQQQVTLVGKIENAVASPSTGKDSSTPPKLDDMQKLMTFSQDNLTRLAAEQREIATEKSSVTDRRAALQAQLNELRNGGKGPRAYKTVTVRVSAANAGSLDLTLDYTVPAAGWTPAYDARLRTETGEVELAYNGIVRQTTGEDWKDVALTLSTARPGLGGGAPKNNPWFVDVFVPRTADVTAANAATFGRNTTANSYIINGGNGSGAAFYAGNAVALGDTINERQIINVAAGAMSGSSANTDAINGRQLYGFSNGDVSLPIPTDAAYAAATVNSAPTSASFKIAAPATVLSDNTPQKVSITTPKLAAELQHEATPALQETTYWIAYVTNTTDFPLLAGAVNVFLDNAFVATSQLKTVMPSEKFQLALGADEGVAIKRRVVNRFAENTGLMGGGRRVTYEYLTTITNNKKTTVHMVFTEALPITKNEKIAVNLLAPAPRDVGTTDKPGKEVTREADNLLWWRIDLKPGEKREIPYKFNIEYPGGAQVSGLQ